MKKYQHYIDARGGGGVPFVYYVYARHFLNMTMSRYTSNSNTCISQNIPCYQNVGFLGKKQKYFLYVITCIKLNNTASHLKQNK